MVTAGFLVITNPERFEQVKGELIRMADIEINTLIDDSRIVVVVRSKNAEDEAAVSRKIAGLEGVLGISLAYHHFGEDEQI